MTLMIDPNTEKGKIQLEMMGWVQDQYNTVLLQYFAGKHKILKGLKIEFRLGLDLDLSNKIKVDLHELLPKDKAELEVAIEEVKKTIVFPVASALDAPIKTPEIQETMATKGGQDGTNKK